MAAQAVAIAHPECTRRNFIDQSKTQINRIVMPINRIAFQCIKRVFTLVLPLLINLTLTHATHAIDDQGDNTQASTTTASAPDFTLKQIHGGNLRLLDYRGKVVLLNFSATWCGPCQQEMPELVKLQSDLKAQDFTVIGISVDNHLRDIERYVHELKANFPVLHDVNQKVSQLFVVKSMPSTVILDRDGVVRFEYSGFQPGNTKLYQKDIQALLAQELTQEHAQELAQELVQE